MKFVTLAIKYTNTRQDKTLVGLEGDREVRERKKG
jgi:hypothetical protein